MTRNPAARDSALVRSSVMRSADKVDCSLGSPMLVMAELELRLAGEAQPMCPLGIARAQPLRVLNMFEALTRLSDENQRIAKPGVGGGMARIGGEHLPKRLDRIGQSAAHVVNDAHRKMDAAAIGPLRDQLLQDFFRLRQVRGC